MLLYVENKAYPLKTFVVLCQPTDTVARVRAQILHSLYEIGHSNHQFRLRFKGNYMRDSYTLEEYKILNNAVIGMVPLNEISEWNKDMRFYQNQEITEKPDVEDLVQVALRSEIDLLEVREKILGMFKTVLMMQILLVFLSLFTVYWYFFFAYALMLLIAFIYCPSFTRIGGWVGKNSVRRKEFMIVFGVLTLLMMGVGIALFSLIVVDLKSSSWPTSRCVEKVSDCFDSARDAIEEGVCTSYQKQCYETSVWTAVYFCLEILVMLGMSIYCWILFNNFKFEVGDRIEHYLMQTREIGQVLDAAKHGNISEKRNAAFELATMAASGDDNKFLIVSEEGLDVLISLGLSTDETTQEYATEALAECLAIPAIQDQFVSMGGMRVLTALLNSKNQRTVREAITAISYVVTDSDENKVAVVAEQGLEDLLHASKYTNSFGRRALALIYLDLADYDDTRVMLTARNSTIEALLNIFKRSQDEDTLKATLQTMELLAIEAPGLITSNESLMKHLLTFPSRSLDKDLQFIAAKLLAQYADEPETCEQLASQENIVESLLFYVHSSDQAMQKVLANIAFRITEPVQYRTALQVAGLTEVLTYIQNNATIQSSPENRDSWSHADRALNNLRAGSDAGDDKKKMIKSGLSPSSSTSDLDEDNPHPRVPAMGPRQRANVSVHSTGSNIPGTSGL